VHFKQYRQIRTNFFPLSVSSCPVVLPGTWDTDLRYRDSPGHSGTVGHPSMMLAWNEKTFLMMG